MAIRKNRIDKLIQYWEPRVQAAFKQAIANIKSRSQVTAIAAMIEKGNVEGAIRAVNLDPANFRPFDATISHGFEAAGNFTAASIPAVTSAEGYRTIFQFSVRNPEAENWLSNYAATKVTEILADQEMMIRETLVASLAKGRNPRSAALDLVGRINSATGRREGGMIGLTSSQGEWVRNYRDALESEKPSTALDYKLRDRRFDRAVKAAEAEGRSLNVSAIDDMVRVYQNRALLYRAIAISRTETMAALHEAQQQAMEQAINSGAVDPQAIGFIWRTAEDDRVRDIHEVMDGQRVALGEMFVDGNGNELEFPGDPTAPPETTINCRCWREPDINFLQGVE